MVRPTYWHSRRADRMTGPAGERGKPPSVRSSFGLGRLETVYERIGEPGIRNLREILGD